MRRSALAGAAAVLALAGCTTSVSGVATPPGEARADALEPEVRDLFAGMADASQRGLRALVEYLVEHNHPVLDYTVQECMAFLREHGATDDGVRMSYEIEAGSLVEVRDHVVVGGRDDGAIPSGDVYAVRTSGTVVQDGESSSFSNVEYVGVFHDEVYFFRNCGR